MLQTTEIKLFEEQRIELSTICRQLKTEPFKHWLVLVVNLR